MKNFSLFPLLVQKKSITIFAEYHRFIDDGSAFSFAGSCYQLTDENDKIVRLLPKTKIKVFKTFENALVVVHDKKLYEVIPERSKYIPQEKVKKPGRPPWKPGLNHPWRQSLK